jgi:uncharacterized protein
MTNDVNFFEIGSEDPEVSGAFYGSLFGWDIGAPSADAAYSMIGGDQGGLWDTSKMGGGNWAIFYVQVEDVQQAIDRAEELGARMVIPAIHNDRIEFAQLIDPMGNRFGIWRPRTG